MNTGVNLCCWRNIPGVSSGAMPGWQGPCPPWAISSPGSCGSGDASCPQAGQCSRRGTVSALPAWAWQLTAGIGEGISFHLHGLPPWPCPASSVAPAPVSSRQKVKLRLARGPEGSPRGRLFAMRWQRLAGSSSTGSEADRCGRRRCPRVSRRLVGVHRATWIISQGGIMRCKRPAWALLKCHRSGLARLQKQAGGEFAMNRGEVASSALLCTVQPLPRPVLGAGAFLQSCMDTWPGGLQEAASAPQPVSPKTWNPLKALWSHSSDGGSARGENSNKNTDSQLQSCQASR